MPIKGLKGGIGTKPLGYGLGAAAEESEPNFNQTVLLLHGDGSEGAGNTSNLGNPNYKAFRDNSTSAHAIVVEGDAYGNDFSPYYYPDGYWSEFYNTPADSGGSCNHKILPASFLNDLTIANKSTSTKTVEAWVYPTSIRTSSVQYYAMGWFCKGNIYWDCALWSTSSTTSGKFTAYHYDGTQRPLESSNYFTVGQWYHVALVIASGTIKLYVNGALEGSRTWHGLGSTGIGEVSVIGGTASNNDWNGYISNLRVSSTARYPSAFTPSTSPFTSDSDTLLLTNQSNRFVDNSSSANTFTFQNSPKVLPFSPFVPSRSYSKDVVGGSAYFDGTTDGLKLTDATQPLGTNNFELEFWYYPIGSSNNGYVINTSHNNSSFGPILIYIVSLDVRLYSSSTGSGWNIFNNHNLGTAKANSWNHIYLSRVSNAVYAFVNGVASGGNGTTWNTDFTIATAPLHISTYDSSGSGSAYGYVANVQYNIGSGSTTKSVPTALTTPDSDTYVQLNFNNAGIIDHTMKNNLETEANTRVSGQQIKFGTGSIYFDGTGDFLRIEEPNDYLAMGNDDWTFELFLYATSLTGSRFIWDSRPGSTQGIYPALYWTGSALEYWVSGAGRITASSALTLNTWHHVALCRSSGSTKLFVDGTQVGSTYSDTNVYLSNRNSFGVSGYDLNSSFWSGYMDEIRTTKGVARYPSNFTVPTKAFANR